MHTTGKYLQELMGPAISKGSFNSPKTIYHLTRQNLKVLVSFPELKW